MLRTQNEVKNSEGAKNLMKHRVLNEMINMNATIIFEKENNNLKKNPLKLRIIIDKNNRK